MFALYSKTKKEKNRALYICITTALAFVQHSTENTYWLLHLNAENPFTMERFSLICI